MQKLDVKQMNMSAGSNPALVAVLGTWVLVVVGVLLWMLLDSDSINPFQSFYLIPWIVLATTVVSAPSFYFLYKGTFNPFHPLTFPAWAYLFPALIFGGVLLSTGASIPYFYSYIDDPEYTLPLTLVYIAIGFLAVIVGYVVPVGDFLGRRVERVLPKWEWTVDQTWTAGWLLVIAGTMVNVVGFLNGLLGFQRTSTVDTFDGTIFFLLTLFFQGYYLLWFSLFKTKKRDLFFMIALGVLIALIPMRMAIMGNRGSIVTCVLPITFAFLTSGQAVRLKHGFIFGGIILLSIFAGIVYGTSFRYIKGTDARMSAGDYMGQVGATLDYLSERDITVILADGGQALANRLENLSSLAVVVSNYEKLQPYEESYGLSNNILKDTTTAFIPRFLWNDKPLTSDAHAYSELYFDYADNSFAITVFGDLLRNFGPVGIPLGMLLVGMFGRILYTSLGTPDPAQPWRSAMYFILLSTVSYEAFYATLFPSLVRVAVVCLISSYLVTLLTRRRHA